MADEGLEAPDQAEVAVDLHITSTTDLNAAIQQIQAEIETRSETNVEALADRLGHLHAEMAADAKAADGLKLSLEHLELYHAWLERQVVVPGSRPEADSAKENYELGPDLCESIADTKLAIEKLIKNHPKSSVPRSGDVVRTSGKPGGDEGSAYFKVPAGRRRQMLVMLYCNLFTGPSLVLLTSFLLWMYLPYSIGNWLLLTYVGWVTFDNMTRTIPDPKRVSQSWRHTSMYEHFRDYFPIRLMKADRSTVFDATANYLFCYHPHGVQSAGAFSMASAATGFDELFPGLAVSVQTLGINFKLPFTRENLIALGLGDASAAALTRVLTGAEGSSAVLVTGGAAESMWAHPHKSKVVLKERAGFVKIALRTGAKLVPMWGFGENNLYENLAMKSRTLRKWQRRIQKVISVAPLLVSGRGVFAYSGGLIPHRRPISILVGDPIDVGPAEPNPTDERVQKVHAQYKQAVLQLFNRYKDIYDPKAEPIEFV